MKYTGPISSALALTLACEVVASSLHEKAAEPHVPEQDYSQPLAAGRGAIAFMVSSTSAPSVTMARSWGLTSYRGR
jgi:hypothetical protein